MAFFKPSAEKGCEKQTRSLAVGERAPRKIPWEGMNRTDSWEQSIERNSKGGGNHECGESFQSPLSIAEELPRVHGAHRNEQSDIEKQAGAI